MSQIILFMPATGFGTGEDPLDSKLETNVQCNLGISVHCDYVNCAELFHAISGTMALDKASLINHKLHDGR